MDIWPCWSQGQYLPVNLGGVASGQADRLGTEVGLFHALHCGKPVHLIAIKPISAPPPLLKSASAFVITSVHQLSYLLE